MDSSQDGRPSSIPGISPTGEPTEPKDKRDTPYGPIEEALTGIWTEVLGAYPASVYANFLEQGGDSLTAMELVVRVEETFGVELPLRELFQEPTIASMARAVKAAQNDSETGPLAPLIPPASGADPPPLSLSQERMWFMQQMQPDSSAYNVIFSARLCGALNLEALRYALKGMVKRHATLRTTCPLVNGRPVQKIASDFDPEFPLIEVEGADKEARERSALRQATLEAKRPFDLANGPLWRVLLYRVDAAEHFCLMAMHHIISDAWSLRVIIQEVTAQYNAFVKGRTPTLPGLPIQYADFALWQRRRLQGQELEVQRSFWKQQLEGVHVLELPTDTPRPPVQTYRGISDSRPLRPDLLEKLKRLSNQNDATLFMTLLAAFQVLLWRHTAQEDIAVGVPVANRSRVAVEGLIGAFVNTLVMRTDLGGNPTFCELLARVREVALGAYAHQDMPYAQLVAELNPERELSRSPLFQVMFNVINVPLPEIHLEGIKVEFVEVDHGGAQFDLTLSVNANSQTRSISVNYNSDLFRPATISRLLDHYEMLLWGILENPYRPISALPLLSPTEEHQLLIEWNATSAPFPGDLCIHQLFEAQVERTPEAIALVADDRQVTFRELNRLANRLGHHLQHLGIAQEKMVGVALDRSPELIVSLLAILKAGGAYIPLDPAYPRERSRVILEETQAPILITRERFRSEWPEYQGHVLCLEPLSDRLARESEDNVQSRVGPDDLAVVLYTSGSSGTPKGVLGQHRATVNRLSWFWQSYPFQPGEICCANTPLVFVDSVREIFGPLLQGIPLVLIPETIVRDPGQFAQALAVRRVTRLSIIPSLLGALLETNGDAQLELPGLRYCFVSGEALVPSLAQEFAIHLPHAAPINLYGCSEAAGDSTYFEVPTDLSEPYIPIGRPIANHQVYILDAFLQPVPVGVVGEIFVGGVGLARGYLNRPEMTAERFIPHPFGAPGERIYRTGDLGCYLYDGNIRYLGRRDRQIKLRGMRVELDEIEAVLRGHPSVRDAAVTVRERSPGVTLLTAFVVPSHGAAADGEALKNFLRAKIPEYMVPPVIVLSDALPLLPDGKVDRQALPALKVGLGEAPVDQSPRTPLENALAAIWQRVLGLERIGFRDNFFDLGGHSLLAAQLVTEINKDLRRQLPLAAVFQSPTIEQMAQALQRAPQIASWSPLVSIQSGGNRRPFFCVHGVGGVVWGYARLAEALGPDRPFYGLEARGTDGKEEPLTTFEAMAASYIEALRKVQPEGPFYLGGYSYGGYVAYEMARQLRAQGQEVQLLALLDTAAPHSTYGIFKPTFRTLARFAGNFPGWLGDFAELEPEHRTGRIRRVLRRGNKASQASDIDLYRYFDVVDQLPPQIRRLMVVELAAFQEYRPRPYLGRVTLFRAQVQPLLCSFDPAMGWRPFAHGGMDILPCPGSHHTLLREPYVRSLAAQLHACLEAEDAKR